MQSSLARLALCFSPLLLTTAASLPAYADTGTHAAAQIPIEDFFSKAAFSGAVLSPDGRHLAVLVSTDGGHVQLHTVDLSSMKISGLTSFQDVDIANISWVNNQRIIYSVVDRSATQGDVRYGSGLYAINVDGSGYRQLANSLRTPKGIVESRFRSAILGADTQLLQISNNANSNDVFVTETIYMDARKPSRVVLRLDTVTGVSKRIAAYSDAEEWMMDRQDEVRIAISHKGAKQTIYYRDSADTPWRTLRENNIYRPAPGDFTPAFFDARGNFYVHAEYRGVKALYLYDVKTGSMEATPLASTPGYDLDNGSIHNDHKLLGLRFETDAAGTIWFDKEMAGLQEKVDALLPATINKLSAPARPQTPFVLVQAASDVEPGKALLYNKETGELTPLGGMHPAIDPQRMSPKIMVRYQARDGLEIPAYLTLPKGKEGKNLPMVVMVHGGPWVRGGHWEWQREAQFLASRGYAVLEPDYRGSTGYGAAHHKAGWKQWGLKMQDDIADGTHWAIAQGYADPQRICIAGASYGGYSTLMGLLNDPGLYKCGINQAGVTDINMMGKAYWGGDSGLGTWFNRYTMNDMLGNAVADAAQLKATSPIEHAARITQPVLLGYGSADQRVPIGQSSAFRDAVQKNNPQLEWVAYEAEGHRWTLPKTSVDFWRRAEKLLARSIGPDTAAAASTQ
ncbi:S9 family peptidase [Janthinobacterium sp. Mn2066]|uniref:S9 family peptidase n=1 Tax=Janthinobacterium sp. Mn2066 TaxID=3395264 RepID=UPI003BE0316E